MRPMQREVGHRPMNATGRLEKNPSRKGERDYAPHFIQHAAWESKGALATAKMHHNDHCAAVLSAAGGMLSAFE